MKIAHRRADEMAGRPIDEKLLVNEMILDHTVKGKLVASVR